MEWLTNLFNNNDSVAHIVLLYSIVIAGGVLLGKVKIAGISLGVTFVLSPDNIFLGDINRLWTDTLCLLHWFASWSWFF